MSTALQIPQGATVLTLEPPTLLQVIQTANSIITPYCEALEIYELFVNLQKWCVGYYEERRKIKAVYSTPKLADYGWDADSLNEYNKSRKIHTIFGVPQKLTNSLSDQGINYANVATFCKKAVKNNSIQPDIDEAKKELEIAERKLEANTQYVNLIPPQYRYPLALDEISSYLSSYRAENWKEAVNLFEEQLHRWQMEENSEQALLLQAQTAVLAGKASSRAGTAALFSGLNFFLK